MDDALDSTAKRKKIGLALSGGGAKGAAHVGVLRYLEANNIAIDYIAGTSIGAYVGGLYALGYSANEIEVIMLELDWSSGFDDSVPRTALNFHDKQDLIGSTFRLILAHSTVSYCCQKGFYVVKLWLTSISVLQVWCLGKLHLTS